MMGGVLALLLLPIVIVIGEMMLAAVALGSDFGYAPIMYAASLPVSYVVVLLFGLPVVFSRRPVPSWRKVLVGLACAAPATLYLCFGSLGFLLQHLIALFVILVGSCAIGGFLGRAMVYRRRT
jgi:hypothetical protein